MRIELQRKIDRIVGKALCRPLSLFPIKKKDGNLLPSSPKILIIILSEMGSLVLAHPMFSFLRNKYPDAEVFALVFEKNRECLETLQLVPQKNILTVDGDSLSALLIDSIRFIVKMRKEKIDAVLDCELFSRISSIYSVWSQALIPWLSHFTFPTGTNFDIEYLGKQKLWILGFLCRTS